MTHRHRPKSTRTVCYSCPVSSQQNPVAHGNIMDIDTCSCGYQRRVNRNANAAEYGHWLPPEPIEEPPVYPGCDGPADSTGPK